ncbi:MAG TPA: hypothetical protein VJN29_00785 [Intrasporangium sp.]|uniref:hypothetical protein n=1 Tax=Intrasporangium sp. TaxID=1925024 RepID=UPI002B49C824|nr:hypothetical protein [Intrasporangium sp.]HKX65734.1 hypothetical protein [Intrasporangium sp.]
MSARLRRSITALTMLTAAVSLAVAAAPASAAPASAVPSASTPTVSVTANGVNCTNVVQIGTKKVVWDRGMEAFTVRQYKGYCRDAKGSAWMNFASVYVWQQYHVRGFAYRAYAGIAVRGELETRGFKVGANRQRLTYSTPVRTINDCTRGWGKLYRLGDESRQGLTSERC